MKVVSKGEGCGEGVDVTLVSKTLRYISYEQQIKREVKRIHISGCRYTGLRVSDFSNLLFIMNR